MTNSAKGLKLALLAALISGVSIFINKFAVASLGNPLILPTIKNSLVGLLFVGLLLGTKKWQKVKSLNKNQGLRLLAVGIIGGSLPFYLFFTGLSQIPAVNAAIIQKSLVFWVALLAVPFLKEKLTKTQGLAVLLLFAGNLMVGGFRGLTFATGEVMVLGATLLWAVETIFVKKLLIDVDSDLVATARMGLGSLLLIATSIIVSPTDLVNVTRLTSTQWFWIALTSVTLFGYVNCWYKALHHESAVNVSATLVLATLLTNILSAILITHTWNFILTIQGLTIMAGILIISKLGRKTYQKELAVQRTE